MKNLFFTLLALLFVVGCSPKEEVIVINSLKLEPANVTLEIGASQQLRPISDPYYDNLEFNWDSADEAIATVDDFGVVTAVGAGVVQIRCHYGSNRLARCTVQVVESGSSMGDPSLSLESPLSQSMIFSSRQLAYPGTVMQCFDFYDTKEDSYIYYTQCASDGTTGNKWLVALSRVKRGKVGDTTRSGETMSLRWFGHGTVLCIERATDGKGDYMWVNSNGTLSGTEYTNNKTFSRFRFEPNATYDHYTGENFYLGSYKDATGASWAVRDLQVNIDFVNRRLLIGCRTDNTRHNVIYDLDAVMALKEEKVSLTRTWGGESGTNTSKKTETTEIMARKLDNLTPLGSFRLPSYLNSDGSFSKPYSCSHQGHAIWGNYVYWYEGNARELQSGSGVYDGSHAYVEVFDYNGNRVTTRTKVAAASDFTNLKALLNLHNNCFCEAEGMQIKNGNKLYLGITTHIAGKSSGNRLSSILEYDCEVK